MSVLKRGLVWRGVLKLGWVEWWWGVLKRGLFGMYWWGVLKRGLVGHPRARLVEHPNQSQKSEVWFGGASYSEVGWSILILNKSRFGGVS